MRTLCLCALVVLESVVEAAPASWWEEGPYSVIDSGAAVNNRGPANLGQGKHFAWSALQVLGSVDPDIADAVEADLVGPGQILTSWNPSGSEYSPILIGQVKAISTPFYENLNLVAPTWLANERTLNGTESGGVYPWTNSAADDSNHGIANVGQLKAVFSLRFTDSLDGDPGADYLEYRWIGTSAYYFNPTDDADGDGISNLEELKAFSNPYGRDVDADGLTDGEEVDLGLDPFDVDSDDDGIPDGQTDNDGDGMSDQWELMLIEHKADPFAWNLASITAGGDEDGDGVSNFQEYQSGLSGHQLDSDGDGYSDGLSVDEEVFLRLDASSGISAEDSSDKERDGQLAGSPAWQASSGVEGGALQFNGGSDALALLKDVLDGAEDLTVSLWFKTSSSPSGQTLLSSADATQAPEFAITLEGGNTVRLHVGGGNSMAWTYGRSLADGFWHQLAVTRDVDVATGEVALFIDGALFGAPQDISPGLIGVDAVALGQRHASSSTFEPSFPFTGVLDNVRVHSKVLDEELIAELFRPNDLDADGLPDDWESALTGNLATLVASGDDPDGDGLTNRQEYEGGTNPTDYYNGVSPYVALVSGSGQTIYNGQRTKNPLVFKVTSNGTTPLVGAPLLLEHLELIGAIETLDGDTLATALTLKTDSLGLVKVHFKAD